MVEHLLTCLKDYKIEIDYKNVDFNADVVALYTRIQEDMGRQLHVNNGRAADKQWTAFI